MVRTPAGDLVLDATGRVAGRGAYLCVDGTCWQTAVAKGALSRALAVPLNDEIRMALEAGPTDTMKTMTTGGVKRGEE